MPLAVNKKVYLYSVNAITFATFAFKNRNIIKAYHYYYYYVNYHHLLNNLNYSHPIVGLARECL